MAQAPMATSFTMLKDLDASSDQQNWCLKVRVIKKWSISTVEDKYRRPILEMIVMDQMGHRIQCSIHRRFFENDRTEGRLYSLTNFSLAANDEKYKPTFRALHVMGLLTAKGDIVEFSKNGKKSIYIVVELDDMQDKGTITCTLWEEFATMQDNPTIEYILIIQFAKFNFLRICFASALGVSNTNYNSILYINLDLKEVKDFRQSFIIGNDQCKNVLTQIPSHMSYSLEDDMLNRTPCKPICEIKELTEVSYYYLIINGWYKGCKLCDRALKEEESSFYCMFCDLFPNTHVHRFCVQLRVSDDTDNASFVICKTQNL
ncbi:uncharacterized protein [Arachis hypogaea]|uniref:uncharacterized protein n=1 Tax=Arachis hypogaea TaxID=3818 RepID=UPI000DEC6747